MIAGMPPPELTKPRSSKSWMLSWVEPMDVQHPDTPGIEFKGTQFNFEATMPATQSFRSSMDKIEVGSFDLTTIKKFTNQNPRSRQA